MNLTVLNFPRNVDVPAQLRKLADDIEAGDYGEVRAIGCAVESATDFEVLGLGEVEAMKLIGLFTTAAMLTTTNMIEEY